MNKTLVIVAALLLVGVGCGKQAPAPGGDITAPAPEAVAPEPPKPNRTNPVSYELDESNVVTERLVAHVDFLFTPESLAAKSAECGTNLNAEHFQEVIDSFSNKRGTEYRFLHRENVQEPKNYSVTVLRNGPGYETFEEFKRDFDVCAVGSQLYPHSLSEHHMVFESSCGTGFDDGSGRPIGCSEIRDQVEGTLDFQFEK